jgi:two-component system response regulator DevR
VVVVHPSGAPGSARGTPSAVRVVLADPHDVVRRGVRRVLVVDPGIQVVGEASSVDVARRRIAALTPDVVVSDARFPDGTAVDVCRAARSTSPPGRVAVVTDCTDPEVVYQVVLAGAAAYLLVDTSAAALVDAVRRVAAGQSLLDPVVTGWVLDRLRAPGFAPAVEGPAALAGLTVQQRRIVDLIVDGLTNREIGAVMRLSEQTVKNHVTGLLAKLGLARRTQVAALGARLRRRSHGPGPLI